MILLSRANGVAAVWSGTERSQSHHNSSPRSSLLHLALRASVFVYLLRTSHRYPFCLSHHARFLAWPRSLKGEAQHSPGDPNHPIPHKLPNPRQRYSRNLREVQASLPIPTAHHHQNIVPAFHKYCILARNPLYLDETGKSPTDHLIKGC